MIKNDIETYDFTIEQIDETPPCESRYHGRWGSGKVTALMTIQKPCCDHHKDLDLYVCEGCENSIMNYPKNGKCESCGGTWIPYRKCIKSVVYL